MPATPQEKDCDILGYDSVYWCSGGTCVQLYFDPEDKGSTFPRNIGTDYKWSYLRYCHENFTSHYTKSLVWTCVVHGKQSKKYRFHTCVYWRDQKLCVSNQVSAYIKNG